MLPPLHGAAVPPMGLRSPASGGPSATHPPGLDRVTKKWLPQKRSRRAVTYIHPHKGTGPSVPSARRRGHRAACLEGRGHTAQLPGHMAAFEHPASILIPHPSLRGACWRTGWGSPLCGQDDAGGARLRAVAGPVWEPRGASPACQVRPAHAGRGMGASMSRCSKAWRNKQRGIFFFCVCIYNISRLQLNPHPCLGSSSQGTHRLSPF